MKLIVGLGNPGTRYDGTRHNLGADAVARAARELRLDLAHATHHALWGRFRRGGTEGILALPQTFMNDSGRAVVSLAQYYKLAPAEILVVSDDLNLPLGRLRFRAGGSAGGHNGLKSVGELLGTDEYARLRLGIGRPEGTWDQADYVLARFAPAEREAVDALLERAAGGILRWFDEGLEAAARSGNG